MALSKKQIEQFKKRLLEIKEQLSNSVISNSKDVKTPEDAKGYSQHQADEGTDDFVRTITLGVASSEASVLKQIDHALKKIEEGTYGKCDITDKDIPVARLEAIPYASMTVQAQEQQEKGLI